MTERSLELSAALGELLLPSGRMVATAESCTGGMVAGAITDIAGSSNWFDRGFVTYSNQAKMEMLGVSAATLSAHGAVSEATVREMARGAVERSAACLSVAISGVAGPGGGSAERPVGLVWFAWAESGDGVQVARHLFDGDRVTVRKQATETALEGLLAMAAEARQ